MFADRRPCSPPSPTFLFGQVVFVGGDAQFGAQTAPTLGAAVEHERDRENADAAPTDPSQLSHGRIEARLLDHHAHRVHAVGDASRRHHRRDGRAVHADQVGGLAQSPGDIAGALAADIGDDVEMLARGEMRIQALHQLAHKRPQSLGVGRLKAVGRQARPVADELHLRVQYGAAVQLFQVVLAQRHAATDQVDDAIGAAELHGGLQRAILIEQGVAGQAGRLQKALRLRGKLGDDAQRLRHRLRASSQILHGAHVGPQNGHPEAEPTHAEIQSVIQRYHIARVSLYRHDG
eukprot:ctg_2412.g451